MEMKTLTVNGQTFQVTDEKAAGKDYVDALVGDMESALDGILAIQEALIGGDGT